MEEKHVVSGENMGLCVRQDACCVTLGESSLQSEPQVLICEIRILILKCSWESLNSLQHVPSEF